MKIILQETKMKNAELIMAVINTFLIVVYIGIAIVINEMLQWAFVPVFVVMLIVEWVLFFAKNRKKSRNK